MRLACRSFAALPTWRLCSIIQRDRRCVRYDASRRRRRLRLARAESVRAALLLVERGEAPLGIVYATDAAASKGVRVVGTFPDDTHSEVREHRRCGRRFVKAS